MHERTKQGAGEWFEGVRGLDGRVRASREGFTAFRKPLPCSLPTMIFHGKLLSSGHPCRFHTGFPAAGAFESDHLSHHASELNAACVVRECCPGNAVNPSLGLDGSFPAADTRGQNPSATCNWAEPWTLYRQNPSCVCMTRSCRGAFSHSLCKEQEVGAAKEI